MKRDNKRTYFIVASIIQVLIGLYVLIFAKDILKQSVESMQKILEMLPNNLKVSLSSFSIVKLSGILFGGGFTLLTNLIILYISLKKDIYKSKTLILILSILNILIASDFFSVILSIVNIIIISTKKKDKSIKKVTKNLPKLSKINYSNKEILFSVLFLLVYLSSDWWYEFVPDFGSAIINMLVYDSFFLIITILIFRKTLARDIKALKENFKVYKKFVLSKLGIMYLLFIPVSIIAGLLTGNNTTLNQEALDALPKLYLIPTAIIWAPIVEECMMRGVLRRVFKNKIIFIFASAILFGVIHTMYEPTLLEVLVKALPYATMGGTFAYMYVKTDNICTNMAAHSIHNTIATIIRLFI